MLPIDINAMKKNLQQEQNLLELFESDIEENIQLALELQKTVKSEVLEKRLGIYQAIAKEFEQFFDDDIQEDNFLEQIIIIRENLDMDGLYLPENALTIPEEIKYFTNLELITQASGFLGRLKNISINVFQLPKLETLILNGNDLSSLPENIPFHNTIKEISLRGNKITKLPESIGNLQRLEQLDLSYNPLPQLPKLIEKLQNLKKLGLSNCYFRKFPEEILALKNLEALDLSGNEIDNIPDISKYLPSLKYINLNNNSLKEIPESILNYKNIEFLGLNSLKTQVKELPKKLYALKKLKVLQFGNNGLEKLSSRIKNLGSLEKLELEGNQLSQIPKEIKSLKNLETLNIASNQITHLPDSICDLEDLETLHICNNQIYQLPKQIEKLQKLAYFFFDEDKCSISEEFQKVIDLNEQDILP